MKFTSKAMSEQGKTDAIDSYFARLNHTVDDFYRKVVAGKAKAMAVYLGGERIGFYLLDADRTLVLWDFKESAFGLSRDWMDQMVTNGLIASAVVSTRQPSFLSLCLDCQKGLSVDAYLFEARQVLPMVKRPLAGLVFELARREEIKVCKAIVGEPDPGYLKSLYDNQGLYVLKLANEVLAMGELRLDDAFPAFADLGMATAPEHRRKGLAAYMVSKLLMESRRRGLTPNASCDHANVGSKKALEKAGMMASHRLLKISF